MSKPGPHRQSNARGALAAMLAPPLMSVSMIAAVLSGAVMVAACEERAETAEQRTQNLSRTVMSPFCPGRTLDTCPSPKATEWRNDIRKWVDEGVSNDEIRRRLYGRAPDVDLTGGPNTGVGMWFPVAAAAAALGLLVFVLKRLSAAQKTATPAAPQAAAKEAAAPPDDTAAPDDTALEARLNDELQQND